MSYSLKILVFREKANVTMILLEKNTSTASTFSSGNLGATRGSGVAIPSLLVALPTTILELILLMNYIYLFISCYKSKIYVYVAHGTTRHI